ncbi:MAG: hypothetical protein KF812_12935 [Fimbriimonadaceae bacterium]|nr:hypothetical protein [Fimbriimonadaceae bacterium]
MVRHCWWTSATVFALAVTSFAQPGDATLAQMLTELQPRELGPGTMGGRIMDLAVIEDDPRIFYLGAAAGGVWRTTNGGMTFEPIFSQEGSGSVGAIAVSQKNHDLIWVGTGEASSRNTTLYGDGIYKSTDGGKSWKKMGLPDSRQIGKIRIDPNNDDVVFVAALGQLWGPNSERGLFKTTDGGATWKKVLYVDENTGAVDVDIDPKNPKNMIACLWDRRRNAWNVQTRGGGSAMYRSTDGGNTWTKVSRGLPQQIGRMGVDYYFSNPKVVYATIDGLDGGVFKSVDGGESWSRQSNLNPRPFYFSEIRVSPRNENRLYVLGVSLHISTDGGHTFRQQNDNVHSDWHAFWIDENDGNHLIAGTDGGVSQSRDGANTWESFTQMPLGQFYHVSADNRKPYWVYGGLQDNGSWAGPTQTRRGGVIAENWMSVGGGDGFTVYPDPNDWTTVYSESQGGALQRQDVLRGGGRSIRVRDQDLRFNWHTPFILSPHNSQTIYVGSQYLYKSVNRGDIWQRISPDLTTNDPTKQLPPVGDIQSSAENHCTIVAISESPRIPGVIWVGTDDGNVQVTEDGGATWTNVRPNVPGVPQFTYVRTVEASRHADGRCYVAFDGHRNNDYKPYVYVTEDYGKSWKALSDNLPLSSSTYVCREGIINPDLLVVGGEFGMCFSIDRGESWAKYQTGNWPTVRVDDFYLHPRENDLVIATHGRSLWTVPIRALELTTPSNRNEKLVAFRPQDIYKLGRIFSGWFGGDRSWMSRNTQPGTILHYWMADGADGRAQIRIENPDGTGGLPVLSGTANKGLNSVSINGNVIQPGDYGVTVSVGELTARTSLHVEDVTEALRHDIGLD